MWTLLRLAVRNVLRNRSRSAFTVSAIAFGVMMSLFLGGFSGGFIRVMIEDTVLGKVGALQVHRRGYDDAKESDPLKFDMPQGGEIVAKILATPGVTGVTSHVNFTGLINNGSSSTMIAGIAEDPLQEYKVLPLATRGLAGKALSVDTPSAGVVGYELANAMGVKAGSSVTLQAATRGGQQNALDMDVAGTVNNNAPMESKRMVHVPLAWAQELLDMKGRVTEYAIAVARLEDVDRIAADMQRRLGKDYQVQTWSELRANLADIIKIQEVILAVVSSVFLIIAVVGVVNTMLMSVLERTREIGTMMAVGVKRGQVMLLFMMEAAALACIGVGAGAAGGFGVLAVIVRAGGIKLTAPGSTSFIAILPAPQPWIIITAVGLSTVGSLCAAVWPAFRASRLRPVEALRAV